MPDEGHAGGAGQTAGVGIPGWGLTMFTRLLSSATTKSQLAARSSTVAGRRTTPAARKSACSASLYSVCCPGGFRS